jgi:hypothetical protein
VILLATLVAASSIAAGDTRRPCEPPECLARLRKSVAVTAVDPIERDLVGFWNQCGPNCGMGLAGQDLLLFDDHTYIYVEWADVLPATIFDKGQWRVVPSGLEFVADPEVTWETFRRDRRFLTVESKSRSGTVLLFGIDSSLEMFERLGADKPEDWLTFLAFRRAHGWEPGQSEAEKQRLLKCCWRPTYFPER